MKNTVVKKSMVLALLIVFCFIASGCGETVSGVGKDVRRVGKGVKTIFIKESGE